MLLKIHDKTGLGPIGRRQVRREFALGVVIFHLQIAQPTSLGLLGAGGEIAQGRLAKTPDAGAPFFIDRLEPIGLLLEILVRLRRLRGTGRLRRRDFLLQLSARGVAAAPQMADELRFPLRKMRDGPFQVAEKLQAPADAQIDPATHNRS